MNQGPSEPVTTTWAHPAMGEDSEAPLGHTPLLAFRILADQVTRSNPMKESVGGSTVNQREEILMLWELGQRGHLLGTPNSRAGRKRPGRASHRPDPQGLSEPTLGKPEGGNLHRHFLLPSREPPRANLDSRIFETEIPRGRRTALPLPRDNLGKA